jgi:DNA-binding MarR family transcriptional regulator
MKTEVKQVLDAFSEVFKSIHQRSYHKMGNKNLYPGQPKLLVLIKSHEGITQKELSEKNFVTPATITGMLNKLEANKLVTRVPDEDDKRMMRIYLTPEGLHLAEQGEKYMVAMTEQLFEGFTDEELRTFVMLAEKVRDNLHNKENNCIHNKHHTNL